MDLIGLDKNFYPVSYIQYINLQWNRRYYEAGNFSIQICAADYDPDIKYVYSPDRPEVGLMQKVQLNRAGNGDFVQLSGSFLESLFNRIYAYPHITGDYTLKALAERFVRYQWYKLDVYDIAVSEAIPEDVTVTVNWQNEPLGDCAYNTLKALEMSQRILYNAKTNALTYETWQGLDRTQDQSENAYALFSEDCCYVSDFSYTEDESGYRNHAVVFYGRDSMGDPYRHDVYTKNWKEEGRRWILMNVDDTLTENERTATAHEELLKYPIVQEAGIKVIQSGLLYRTDYDLGDKCDVACNLLKKAFSARITGVDEVFKQGQHQVAITLGENERTSYQRVARFARSDRRANAAAVITDKEEA